MLRDHDRPANQKGLAQVVCHLNLRWHASATRNR